MYASLKQMAQSVTTRFTTASMSLMSGAIAFFALLSLAPVLVIAVNIAGLVFGRTAARAEVMATLRGVLGPDAAQVVVDLAAQSYLDASTPWTTLASATVIIYAGTRVFGRLQEALNAAWGVRQKTPDKIKGKVAAVLRKRFVSFIIALLLGVMVFASMAFKTVLATIDRWTGSFIEHIPYLWPLIELGSSLLVTAAFIAAVYHLLPDVVVRWRDAIIGAITTTIIISLGSSLISVYLGYYASKSVSGAVGSVIILMLWIYFVTNVVFIGALVARANAERCGIEVQPEPHAERIDGQ